MMIRKLSRVNVGVVVVAVVVCLTLALFTQPISTFPRAQPTVSTLPSQLAPNSNPNPNSNSVNSPQLATNQIANLRQSVNGVGSTANSAASNSAVAAPVAAAIPSSASQTLQAHLGAIQAQAQRQLGQLNGLMISGANQLVASATPLAAQAANLTGQAANKYGNMLEALANVGKAIQHQIMQNNNNPNAVQIVTSAENAAGNSKKNEYQSIVVNDNQPLVTSDNKLSQNNVTSNNYREQGELLRQEIVKRAGQLQQVVASSMDVLKNNGDLIIRRLLEQLNHRLDQAKSKADKIINEPATNEVALKALGTINLGLNNLNTIITNIVSRLDLGAKNQAQAEFAGSGAQRTSNIPMTQPLIIDTNKLRQNLHQLGQHFSSALNASQHQRQWHLNQQQAPANGGISLK